jgi:hypothetical protein
VATRDGSSAAAPSTGAGRASDALLRLRRGEITLDEYLDFRADEAIRDIEGVLPTRRVAVIRETLRQQLAMDPVLVGMVEHLTASERPSGAR